MSRSNSRVLKESLIGRRVKITWDTQKSIKHWDGVYTVTDYHYDDEMICIEHPEYGLGGFYPSHYEILPLTKLEKALS